MSHHLPQESQQTERGSHSHRGIMDLRNLCQRLDVDSLKAKLPTLPQLKLPKSLPKLRGARRIFRNSRENVNSTAGPGQGSTAMTTGGVAVGLGGIGVAAAVPHAQFINRTPQRISTISSLMHEQATVGHMGQMDHHHLQPSGATYCSAGSLDDDYYAPYGNATARVSRPISPVKMPAAATVSGEEAPQRASLTQRLQRSYKSLSELRLKHLFAKQTTIRRDGIEVQHYVQQYEADRRVEQLAQARRDRQIADNYDIHISTLPITRQNTLKQQQQQEQEEEEGIVEQVQRRQAEHSGDESGLETPPPPLSASAARRKKAGIAATRFSKVRQPPLQMPVEQQQQQQQQEQDQSEEQQQQREQQERQPMRQAMRQNLKRLRKSIKRVHQTKHTTDDNTDDEETTDETKMRTNTASTLRARLRRFASSEQLQQRWRKSFKASEPQPREATDETQTQPGAAAGVAAQLERTMTKLNEKMQQLKFFQRSSEKTSQQVGNKPNTVGREPVEIDDDELAATYHHTDSSDDDNDDNTDHSGRAVCAKEAFGKKEEQQQQQQQQHQQSPMLVKHQTMATLAQLQAHTSTAWSSESLEEDGSMEQQLASTASDYPRVLIHQQHTDAYESTLIIAVTTTSPSPSSPSPPPQAPQTRTTHHNQWVPNEQIIAGFKEQQQICGAWPAPSLYKPKSIDIFESDGGSAGAFADFDEVLRNAPVLRISAGSSCDSTEDADDSSSRVTKIRVQTPRIGNSCESLMEQQPLDDDDDDEDADAEQQVEEEEEEEEEEQEQVQVQVQKESESERPPSVSPPPPPLPQRRPPPPAVMAPIYDAVPPPLPISKPPTIQAATAPPITTPKSPIAAARSPVAAPLARLPQRSASMTRPAKPLVKTSSLRLTYNEQMRPGDVGKVNKLISRFEGRPRLCARRLHSEELTICSDEETEELPPTPTPANVKRNSNIPDIVTTQPVNTTNNNLIEDTDSLQLQIQLNLDRQNSNCSRSEYGSPLSYPHTTSQQRRSSTPTMLSTTTSGSGRALGPQSQSQPQSQLLQQRAQTTRRNRRSMTRDDDNFYSFDSDEENSYYSISPSSSSRYVVEI